MGPTTRTDREKFVRDLARAHDGDYILLPDGCPVVILDFPRREPGR
jgi:hypothetical protein